MLSERRIEISEAIEEEVLKASKNMKNAKFTELAESDIEFLKKRRSD